LHVRKKWTPDYRKPDRDARTRMGLGGAFPCGEAAITACPQEILRAGDVLIHVNTPG
jgi:hypothetical protein